MKLQQLQLPSVSMRPQKHIADVKGEVNCTTELRTGHAASVCSRSAMQSRLVDLRAISEPPSKRMLRTKSDGN